MIDVQMDILVDELTAEGYVKKLGRTKIYLTDDGRKKVRVAKFLPYQSRIPKF